MYYLHGDYLGSTSLTTDENGDVFSEGRYLPYGQEHWATGISQTDFGFTAQRYEASFGLMDYKARYYDPLIGRFISPDPLVPEPTSSSGFNRYRYARNNPLNYIDPSGYCGDGAGSGHLGAEVLSTVCKQLLKYREDIFFPNENTTTLDRVEAAYVVGVLSVAIAATVTTGFILEGNPTLDQTDIESTHPTAEEIEKNNQQIRKWYNDQVEPISESNEGWIAEGLSAEERARRAYKIRHDARLRAREMMIDRDGVARLRQRDMDKYGNPDGPTFEQLVKKAEEKGYTGDAAYEYIIGSSRRTDKDTNKRFGIER